jgi:beta-glucosidase
MAASKPDLPGFLDDHFKKRHEEILQRLSKGQVRLVFFGDSIMEDWSGPGQGIWSKYYAPLDAVNFGIRGNTIEFMRWRIDNGELDGISPKVLILLIGTNNIFASADGLFQGSIWIVRYIHAKLPKTRILILGIFPRGADPKDPYVAGMRVKIKAVNGALALLENGKDIRYLDIGDKLIGADGKIPADIMPDGLHLSVKGYRIWADTMAPLLDVMLNY